MNGAVFQTFLSHWRRHPLQLATLVAGLALATALWTAVQAINAEARASYARAAAQLAGGTVLTSAQGDIPRDRYVALRRAGWRLSPVLEGYLRLGDTHVLLTGVDLLSYPAPPRAGLGEDAAQAPARFLGPEAHLIAAPDLARRLQGIADLPTVLASEDVPPGVVLTDIAVAERLLDRPGRLTRLLVLPEQDRGLTPLEVLAPDLTRAGAASATDAAQLTGSFHLNLTAFGLLSFAVGLFVVHGTVGLAFEQRRPQFRTLRALGVPLRLLTLAVLAELVLLALFAGLAGLALGYVVAAALMPDVAVTLRGLYGAQLDGGLTLRPGWALGGLAMALAGTGVASAQAFWRLTRLPLLAAPGPRAWGARAAAGRRLQALAGVALLAAGGLVLLLFDGTVAGFAFLAGLMLGAALLLPAFLSLVLRLGAARARGPVATWLWSDLRAQLPGISLALMALLLALATNIGVGTMVASFRLTFAGWLDQRLTSDLYITARDDAQGADIARWLAPRSQAVLPIRSVDITAAGQPVSLYGIVDHPSYARHWPLLSALPEIWPRLHAGELVLINEQLARRSGLSPGDALTLRPGWTLTVGGVYSDYGNPTGQAITALPELVRQFPGLPNRRFGVHLAAGQNDRLTAELRAAFDLPLTAIIDQTALKRRSLSVFDKTFVVTGALNLLTLGVAAFTILTSLLTLWSTRLPQLAPVWALGLTRARLARLELLRSLALAGLTALLALPLGLLLAWALLAVINVEAFGWRLPMHVFPADWLRLLGLALLAAALAAAYPAWRLYRLAPAELLKVFADAR